MYRNPGTPGHYSRARYALRKQKALSPRQKKQVKKLVRNIQELKYFQYSGSAISNTSTAQITGAPFDIAQGDQDQERDGDRFQWCGTIDFRISFIVSDVLNVQRIIVVQWHPSSNPSPTDILIVGPTTNVDILSQYNHDNRQQYKILLDKVITTVGNGTAGTYPGTTSSVVMKRYKISLKKASKQAQRIGGGLSGTNRIYLLYVSDSTIVPHPQFNYSMKSFFRDS